MNGATEIKNLTKAQCAEIGRFFFNGKKADITIYSQLRGERTLTKEVAVAAQMYLDFEVTSETTREQLLKEYANRYRSLSMADFEQLQGVREGFGFINQQNPLADASEGVDLTPEQITANYLNSQRLREGIEL
jgi:hypothetical protein